jgi:hypothetical protein
MATDLKWRGLAEGYVSHDGRFLVQPVVVPGKKGTRKAWALYGRVLLHAPEPSAHPPQPWGWTEQALTVGSTKGECQRFAAESSYEVKVVGLTVIAPSDDDRPSGYSICRECTVRFEREDGHRYDDYCGKACVEVVAERLNEILGKGVKLHDTDGRPLRVGAPRPNEPDFVPHRD